MNIGIYVGSFKPPHMGHVDVIRQAERVFDKVIIARGENPQKTHLKSFDLQGYFPLYEIVYYKNIFDMYQEIKGKYKNAQISIIRGIRDGSDMEEAFDQFLKNANIQVVYFRADNKFRHMSSGAIRELESIGENKKANEMAVKRTYLIGITGRIAAGKSTVVNDIKFYDSYGRVDFDFFDFDRINKIAVERLADELSCDSINSHSIKEMALSDDRVLKLLEFILIQKSIRIFHEEYWQSYHHEVLIIEDPMMIVQERGKFYDLVYYVDAPDEVLIQRIMKRYECTREYAEKRLKFFDSVQINFNNTLVRRIDGTKPFDINDFCEALPKHIRGRYA